jgi:hypothetical protein
VQVIVANSLALGFKAVQVGLKIVRTVVRRFMILVHSKTTKQDSTDAQVSEKTLTLKHVAAWVERWKRHLGRLRFFADLPPTPYFICVAKPLLSMKTTGSISVERAAKPLKNKIADKTRNRNSKDKRTVLLRCGLNLRLKRQSLVAVKAALGKALDPDDALVYE